MKQRNQVLIIFKFWKFIKNKLKKVKINLMKF